ncbi:ABC transporter substrate-binding protein [bacterium]|nr:ABC transporter substrate-binding protein [bacterium]MCP5462268.1 ABC transporter substrate-binding protein [bacterium]
MKTITVGHTPDTDDAFMFYALLNGKIDLLGLSFEDFLEPITGLNMRAVSGYYDMTAVSVGYLPQVAQNYHVLTAGACMAEFRGPVLALNKKSMAKRIAVPGFNTTGYYALKLFKPDVECHQVAFDQILPAVLAGTYDGGVIISEDQMRIDATRLDTVDLGKWWREETGLPLPLGVDVVKACLPHTIQKRINTVFKSSIQYALSNTEEALHYALKFGRGIDRVRAETFVKTFVSQYTCSLGEQGENAIRFFLEKCMSAQLFSQGNSITFVDGCE